MAPHSILLPCALAFPPPSHRDATTPSPCWAPHSWPKNASCSRIPPRASHASLPPQRRATTCCRLSLRPCTAHLSCSLWPLLKLSLLSLRTSLLCTKTATNLNPFYRRVSRTHMVTLTHTYILTRTPHMCTRTDYHAMYTHPCKLRLHIRKYTPIRKYIHTKM